MKNRILFFFAAVMLLPLAVRGQGGTNVWDGIPIDSAVFDFAPGDSLYRSLGGQEVGIAIVDSLWQVGGTVKSGFLDGGNGVRGIMTDTLASYPIRQDAYFMFGDMTAINPGAILTFEHRYETTAGKDGGFVEIADNSGTWHGIFQLNSVMTDNFYTAQDTITGGIPAFSGSSNGYIRSRIQLPFVVPLKPAPLKSASWGTPVVVRFRFISDSTADTLAGWNIRRIVLENDLYPGAVTNTEGTAARLSFFPNPTTGLLHLADDFPLSPDQRYAVRDVLGRVLAEGKLERTLDVSGLPKGLYFVQVQGRNGTAVGRVAKE